MNNYDYFDKSLVGKHKIYSNWLKEIMKLFINNDTFSLALSKYPQTFQYY